MKLPNLKAGVGRRERLNPTFCSKINLQWDLNRTPFTITFKEEMDSGLGTTLAPTGTAVRTRLTLKPVLSGLPGGLG